MRIKPFQSRYAVTWDEYPTGISNPNGKVKMVNWCIKNLKLDEITLGFYAHDPNGFYEHNPPNTVNSWMLINLSNDILIRTEEDVHLKLLDHGSLKAIILDDYSKACELADYVDQIHTFNIIKRY